MILKTPFFGSLMCRLNVKPADKDHPTDTFVTDGIGVWYNPAFVESITVRETSTALAEAVLYCVMHHATRRQHREKQKYQTACRYEIDAILLKNNAEMLNSPDKRAVGPWGWPQNSPPLFDEALSKLVAEQIYLKLPDPQGNQPQPQPQPQPSPDGDPGDSDDEDGDDQQPGESDPGDGDEEEGEDESSGAGDDEGDGKSPGQGSGNAPGLCTVIDSPLNSPSEIDHHESKWNIALEQAISVALAQGTLPGSIALLAEKAKPKIPWTYHLRTFVSQFSREDYSFKRPLMSAFAESDGDIILPSLFSETLGEIVIAVDTSGSIYAIKKLLDEFLGEIDAIHKMCQPAMLHFVDCDAKCYDFRSFEPGDVLDFSLQGGGGTDFRPVFDEVKKRGIEPACLIYFTDLEGSFPANPGYPVLWVDYGRYAKAPWGTTIKAE